MSTVQPGLLTPPPSHRRTSGTRDGLGRREDFDPLGFRATGVRGHGRQLGLVAPGSLGGGFVGRDIALVVNQPANHHGARGGAFRGLGVVGGMSVEIGKGALGDDRAVGIAGQIGGPRGELPTRRDRGLVDRAGARDAIPFAIDRGDRDLAVGSD